MSSIDVTTPRGVRALHRAGFWGEDGWTWERITPDLVTSQCAKTIEAMSQPASHGIAGDCKVEMWRNAHWFVTLSRDEFVLSLGQSSDDFPRMIWLSMRRTDRSKPTLHDWREMQRVKNELVGEDHEGVELFLLRKFYDKCREPKAAPSPPGYLDLVKLLDHFSSRVTELASEFNEEIAVVLRKVR